MSNKVVYAKLHAGVFIPGVGNLADTLPPQNKTLKNLSMTKQDDGNLQLTWEDERTATKQSAEVGSSNIIVIGYAPEKIVKSNA
jgi:hypothetical protein